MTKAIPEPFLEEVMKTVYLLQLRSAHERHCHQDSHAKEGDLVVNYRMPRHLWRIGRPGEVYCGWDGIV